MVKRGFGGRVNGHTDGGTDGRNDGQTDPLIEMRGCIEKEKGETLPAEVAPQQKI